MSHILRVIVLYLHVYVAESGHLFETCFTNYDTRLCKRDKNVKSEFFTTVEHEWVFFTVVAGPSRIFRFKDPTWACSKLLAMTAAYGVESSLNLSKIQHILFTDLSYRTKRVNDLFHRKKLETATGFLLGCSCWKCARMWMQSGRSQTRRSVRTRRTGCRRRRETVRV